MKLTDAVKALRWRLGESQQAFATRLGISIRGLVNYEKDRDPPLALLLTLASVARDAGDDKLTNTFQWAFCEQITSATRGHRIAFLQEDERADKQSGLLLLTFANGQFEYASAFLTAMNRMIEGEDIEARVKARRVLDDLVKSVLPGLKPSGKKKQ